MARWAGRGPSSWRRAVLALAGPRDQDVVLGGVSLQEVRLERCGFSREGLLRSHVPFKEARRDSGIYSLLPGELR